MESHNHKAFIKKAYGLYRDIGNVACPAFDNEKIYFNKIGFNHLIWKGKKMRPPYEQRERINLITHAIEIIKISREWSEYREDVKILDNGKISNAKFWSLTSEINQIKIKVIIRQSNNGKKYFLSVM